MPSAIPANAIFCEDQGTWYLVVNWRARLTRHLPAQLLTLSARHAAVLCDMRSRGRTDHAILTVLFLPQVRSEQILPAPSPAAAPAPTAAEAAESATTSPAAAPMVARAGASTGAPAQAAPAPPPELAAPRRRAISLGWGISACLHLVALCICCCIAWLMPKPEVPLPAAPQERLVPSSGPPAEIAQSAAAPDVSEPVAAADQDASDIIQPVDVAEDVTIDETVAARPRQDILGVQAQEVQPGRDMFISARTTDAAAIGPHGRQRRQAALSTYGGNEASQNTVDAALRWLKRAQNRDGSWDADADGGHCPTRERTALPGGAATVSAALSGCALLCFLGAGYDQATPSRYRPVVRSGLRWLLAQQRPDGFFGDNNYSNGIATMALCEALDATGDPAVRSAAQRAVTSILAHQNRVPGPGGVEVGYGQRSGWDYLGPTTRDDSSVTGWNLMALVAARNAGLDVGNGLDGVRDWFDSTWKATNAGIGIPGARHGESRFPYVHMMDSDMTVLGPANGTMCDLAGVGAVAAAFLPHDGSAQELETLANYIERVQLPNRRSFNRYYVYYSSLAMFQLGGRWWSRWNPAMREELIASQRHDRSCFEGSWDDGLGGFCRTFSTELCCLSLEVYYRYDRVHTQP